MFIRTDKTLLNDTMPLAHVPLEDEQDGQFVIQLIHRLFSVGSVKALSRKLRGALIAFRRPGLAETSDSARGACWDQGAQPVPKPVYPAQLDGDVAAVTKAVQKLRILIAEDEAAVRSFLRDALEDGGYDVVEASNGKHALREIRMSHVDLVITDLFMPEQEGIETIQALRREMPGVGIIALSGAYGGSFLRTAELLGADGVLCKPVSAELLLAKVGEVIELRQ